MKFFKRAFIALAAVLIGLSTFTACNSDSKSNEQSMTEVTEVVTTVDSTTTTSTTAEPTTVKTTQPTTKAIKAEAVESEKTEDNEDAEDGSHSYVSSNVDNGTLYSPDEFQNLGVISWGGYQWTYYSELILPGNGLNIPGRHTTEDGYVCDGDGYIVLAADLNMLPRYSIVDTPFGREGKVYDAGCAYGVLDVYVRW